MLSGPMVQTVRLCRTIVRPCRSIVLTFDGSFNRIMGCL